jgi:hypothetical protein
MEDDSLFSRASKPALGPVQTSIKWVPRALSPWDKVAGGMKLTTHSHLVPKLKIREVIPPFPIRRYGVVLNKAYGQLYFYPFTCV